MHDCDGAHAGVIGDLRALAIGRRIAAQPGNDMPSASASAFIVEAVPMVLQWPTDGADDVTISKNSP